MDGLLVIDKPAGPTSHDVVARVRRLLREKRIGHTGTLDPMATGLLLLVLGKATRLARFLTATDKSYDAVVRLGFATDTADAEGQPVGPVYEGPMPAREAIEAALTPFRGTFLQQPPAFSAKKIAGQRSYKLARDARLDVTNCKVSDTLQPAPCVVTAHRLEIVRVQGDTVTLSVDCSAGFYIRSLAHDLGAALGTGGHLTALRRTRSGAVDLSQAMELAAAEHDPEAARAAIIPLAGMLPALPSVVLTAEGITRVAQGQDVRSIDHQPSALGPQPFVKLLTPDGTLAAIAEPAAGGLLHPSIVLM